MAKNRKTKKEKLRTSSRVAPTSSPTALADNPPTGQGSVYTYISSVTGDSSARQTVSMHTMTHLREDLLRTGIVIGAIILAEITLYFALTGM